MSRILAPSVGVITAGLNDAGVPVSVEQVEIAVATLDPLVIRDSADRPLVGVSSPLASTLGTAALLAVMVMLVTGWIYVAVSRDRVRAVRSLLNRFALGALSFAVLLRIGAWIVDPQGGRAPVGESLARGADSKGQREDAEDGERPVSPEQAESEAEILNQGFERRPAPGGAGVLLGQRYVA